MSGGHAEQRHVARIALTATGDGSGFALAGLGAIREHGLIDRSTEDVDLFTTQQAAATFDQSLDRVIAALRSQGYSIDIRRHQGTFAQLTVTGAQGFLTGIDLAVDWRAHEPVRLGIGPVLSLEDAVGNKVAALFSRAEARDQVDVDAIRRSGRFTDEELFRLARQTDPGFDLEWFARSLDTVERIHPEEVRVYGVSPEELDGVKTRMEEWAADIRAHLH